MVFENLGIPVSDGAGKVVGPAKHLKMLSIILDSIAWTGSLPPDKLEAFQAALHAWGQRNGNFSPWLAVSPLPPRSSHRGTPATIIT